MCFVLVALKTHPRYPFILLANRDEFYDRPAEPMHEWEHPRGLLAGKDLKSGGTWMGVDNTSGRLALVTNFREPEPTPGERSRGLLVLDVFRSGLETIDQQLSLESATYSGFNLLYGTPEDLRYHSNRGGRAMRIAPGLHGLSNGLLDEAWPKVARGRRMLEQALASAEPDRESLFGILEDRVPAPDDALPKTGVSLELERMLSPIFIQSELYGTRCSTVLMVNSDGGFTVMEKTHRTGEVRVFEFQL